MATAAPLFYFNGIRDAKGAELQRAFYSPGIVRGCPDGTITIYARDWRRFSAAVREHFNVLNDSDPMTDYFSEDLIRVEPSHPLYAAVRAAMDACEAHRVRNAAKREARRHA